MKNIKDQTKKGHPEVQQLQKLHVTFESQVKKRLAKLDAKVSQTLEKELRESEELFRTTFNHAAIGIAHVDPETGRWIRVNKRFAEIAGWPEKDLLTHTFLQTTHPDDHKVDLELIGDMISGKVPSIAMEKRYVRKDGSIRWVHATASVARYPSGKPKYGIAIVEDIHEKKTTEQMLRILADSSKMLAETLDYKESVSRVVDLLVPKVADWVIVDLLEDTVYRRVKVGYADSENSELAAELYNYPPKPNAKSVLTGKALRTGKSVLVRKLDSEKSLTYFQSRKLLRFVKDIELKSFMAVPLVARGKIIGVISFGSSQASRLYTNEDLLFVEQIANRIGLAVDNSKLYHRVQKAVRIRDDFLAIASHELKTSLTTIKALAQILQRESDAKAGRTLSLFTKMDAQLNRTTKLINDLLDVGNIHRGKYTVMKESLSIDAVVKEAVENCQRFAPMHNIILKGKTYEKVYADKDRIHQVIANLITNAIKYSFDSVDIIVTLRKDKNNVVIGVQDFGIGIEKDKTGKIFERFFRADSKAKERTSGLGLGLYISQELVKQHKGFIDVKSKVGEGSTFYIYLPRLVADDGRKMKTLSKMA